MARFNCLTWGLTRRLRLEFRLGYDAATTAIIKICRAALNIPTSPDAITSEWLSRALKTGGVITDPVIVKAINVFPEGLSATGTLARVEFEYSEEGTGPTSLIVKQPDPVKANRQTGAAFEREIRFYREIGSDSGVKVPVMYFGGTSGELAIILLEDLRPVEPGDSVVGCSFEEAEVAVKGLASLHARWWDDELVDADWLWGKSANTPAEDDAKSIDMGWTLLPDEYMEDLPAELIATCNNTGWFTVVAAGRDKKPQTISHPDYRLDNLFFDHRSDEIELTVIDWGRVAAQRPGFALAFFLADSGLSNEQMSECIDIYWQELVDKGVKDFSSDDCMFEVRIGFVELLGQRLWQFSVGANDGAAPRIQAMRKRSWDRLIPIIDEFDCLSALTG